MHDVLKLYFGLRAKCLWRMIKELGLMVIPFFPLGYTYGFRISLCPYILQCVVLLLPVAGLSLHAWRFDIPLFSFRSETHEDVVFSRIHAFVIPFSLFLPPSRRAMGCSNRSTSFYDCMVCSMRRFFLAPAHFSMPSIRQL